MGLLPGACIEGTPGVQRRTLGRPGAGTGKIVPVAYERWYSEIALPAGGDGPLIANYYVVGCGRSSADSTATANATAGTAITSAVPNAIGWS